MPRRKGEISLGLSSCVTAALLTIADSFGWTNASYIHGLSILGTHAKRALGVCASYEDYAKAVRHL